MKRICLLGATGSIGRQTIDIIKNNPGDFVLVGVTCGKNIEELNKILTEFPSIECYSIQDEENFVKVNSSKKGYCNNQGILKVIENSKPDLVVNALVGFVGFVPSVFTLENKIDLALANKETLVVGGEIIKSCLKKNKAHLYPIDSEHVALAKCLQGKKKKDIKRLILTASGGSFRNLTRDELKGVTVEEALKHPSWSMGNKITIDSATMMNKGFELIEAKYLFDFEIDNISILLHDESIIHSLVEFNDHSFLADIGPADMRIPISYALYGKNRHEGEYKSLDLENISSLHFRKFDVKRYPCVSYAYKAINIGGSLPCVLNASNEEAVYAFLNHQISFLEIEEIIEMMLSTHRVIDCPSVEDLVYVDSLTRKLVKEEIERRKQ
ncbi:MAG: 1-deoxy-D-xylulose-5-phosphate reductoisomerase [Bacillales bacterium]|nr:1-deoxy-D-xylulose-5-phosphate reductoisomerase [Bacillales bacterium]